MSAWQVLFILTLYFAALMAIGRFTGRGATTQTFFTANRSARWYLVAFGMIGASLSGVTFISVPGVVGKPLAEGGPLNGFGYFQVVLGYIVGYAVIALVLLPLYYRLRLVSIYQYLEQRIGPQAYRTGAFFFLLSRVVGASFRLFLVAGVLQLALFNAFGVPFWLTVLVTIALIWLYTFQGGIKTIVYTDTLQTFFLLLAVVVAVVVISRSLGLGLTELPGAIRQSGLGQVFFWQWQSPLFFGKQFLSGAFLAIVMTGLDQDMMQKNLTVRTLKESQKNIYWFTAVLVVVNLFFLSLGALMYMYAQQNGIAVPARTDDLFPLLALQHLPQIVGIMFLLGIVSAAYSSADSALTALTTSFCVDFLKLEKQPEAQQRRTRLKVHLGFSALLFVVILVFQVINNASVITALFKAAGYTYGPLLGLFAFGILTRRQAQDRWVPLVALLCPVLSYIVNANSQAWFGGYQMGFEVLILNGLLTFLGLLFISRPGGSPGGSAGSSVPAPNKG